MDPKSQIVWRLRWADVEQRLGHLQQKIWVLVLFPLAQRIMLFYLLRVQPREQFSPQGQRSKQNALFFFKLKGKKGPSY